MRPRYKQVKIVCTLGEGRLLVRVLETGAECKITEDELLVGSDGQLFIEL